MMQTSHLVAAAKRKDISAYNRLVSSHQDLVYNFAYYILCDATSAVRATQLAFLQAFHKMEGFKGDSIRSWLLQNLIEVCRGKFTGNHKTSRQLESPGNIEIPFAFLPTELRMALALVEIEGLDHRQAADLMGVTPARIAQQLSIARRQLAESLPA